MSKHIFWPQGERPPRAPQTELDKLAEKYGRANVENVYLLWAAMTDSQGLLLTASPTIEQLEAVLKVIYEV